MEGRGLADRSRVDLGPHFLTGVDKPGAQVSFANLGHPVSRQYFSALLFNPSEKCRLAELKV